MNYKVTTLGEEKFIGIAVRTTNKNNQSQKDIGDLWGKFMSQNLVENIPNRVSSDIYCIYTDYESDFNGAYTTILGCKVSSVENVPAGFVSKTIPATTYHIYTSIGKLPECVVHTWVYIWQSDIKRKYAADYDVYGPRAQDTEHAEVETYLSVY